MKLTSWAIRDTVVAGDLPAVVRIFSESFPELRARLDEKWVAKAIKWDQYINLAAPDYSYRYAFQSVWGLSAGHFYRHPLTFPPKENTIYFPVAWRQPA